MDGRKKILYVITKSNWGGAQKYVYDLAVNLPKNKFETVAIVGNQGTLTEKLAQREIRVIKLFGVTKNINILQEIKSFFSLLEIFAEEKPDIVHLNSSKLGGLGALAARIHKLLTFNFKLLIVFTAHGWPFNEDRNFVVRSIIYFFSWLTAALANRVINITKIDYKQSLKFPLLARDKFLYIPNGLEANYQPFLPRAEVRKIFGLDEKQFIIGAIAELTKNKGLEYLIDAISCIKTRDGSVAKAMKRRRQKSPRSQGYGASTTKIKVIVMGDGEDKERLQGKIDSLKLQNEISLAGFRQNAARYLKGFNVLVIPSVKEGLPYVLMEAMNAGLPIIASHVGGIPDLIEHEKNGILIKAKDCLGLAEELEKIIQNPERYKTMAREAEKTVRTKFPFHAMLQKTLTLYE